MTQLSNDDLLAELEMIADRIDAVEGLRARQLEIWCLLRTTRGTEPALTFAVIAAASRRFQSQLNRDVNAAIRKSRR